MPPPDLGELAGWCVLLGALAAAVRMTGAIGALRRRRALIVAAAAAAFLVGSQVWRSELAPRWRDELRAAFVNVGQGDAAVIEAPGGGVWLIDGGGLPFSLPTRDPGTARRLGESPGRDARGPISGPAPHPPHRPGDPVARPPRPLPRAGRHRAQRRTSRSCGSRAATATRRSAPSWSACWPSWPPAARWCAARRPAPCVRRGGATLTVLAPGPSPDGGDTSAALDPVRSENDNSLVVRIDYAGRRLLFTGDLEEEGEEDLVREHGASET